MKTMNTKKKIATNSQCGTFHLSNRLTMLYNIQNIHNNDEMSKKIQVNTI